MIYTEDSIRNVLKNSSVNSSVQLRNIIRNKKNTIFELECPRKSIFPLKSTIFNQKIEKGELLCSCCNLIRKQEEAEEIFKQYGYKPIGMEKFKKKSSRIRCYDSEGYIVHVSLQRLQDPSFKAQQGRFDIKYLDDSTHNLYLLFSRVDSKLSEYDDKRSLKLLDSSYRGADVRYLALKDNKYRVGVTVGKVNEILKSHLDKVNLEFILDPFCITNPYRHTNAKIYLTERGIIPIPNDSGEILRYEGGRIFVFIQREEEFLGKKAVFKYKLDFSNYRSSNDNLPSKSSYSNPYLIENMQNLIKIKGWDCEIIEISSYDNRNVFFKVKASRGGVDYFAITSRDSIMATNKNSHPLLFSKYNPYTIANIKKFCEYHRPDYELLSTDYNTAHEYLKFKYIGSEEVKGGFSEFEMSWSNFSGMKNPSIFVTSRAESMLLEILKSKGFNVGTQNRFEDCIFKSYLKFDAVIFKQDFDQENSLKKNFVKKEYLDQILLVIEYQGIFHYEDIYGQRDEQVARDDIKKNFCKEHNIPFEELVQVPHQKIEQAVDYILSKYSNVI